MAKLYFRYGAMGCGKTMQLLQVAFNYEERGQKVAVFKPQIDTKANDKLQTRIGPERKADYLIKKNTNLKDLIAKKFSKVACVLIDEAQFLSAKQVDQLMETVCELNIPVMCYGLRLNSNLTDGGFAGATRLLQLADNIEELKTICDCGRKATLNCRFRGDQILTKAPNIMIDDGKNGEIYYKALCPKCYYKYSKKSI